MSRTLQYEIPEHLVARQEAKRGERVVQIAALSGAVACLVAASFFPAPIDAMRTEHQMTLDPESTKGLPPDIALLTKAGTFRALAIDFLFIRMENLKQDNKYYELDKLSSMICKLAPRYPGVWKYAAWNMSYNISVSQYTPEGRWYWVKNGIELLRNQGLRYNPRAIGLYLELAYIFWHKVGDFLDDQHWNYKKELAVEMERVLGAPTIAVDEETIIADFAQIAHAPERLEDLPTTDPDVALFIEKLAEVDLEPNDALLEFVARHLRNELQVDDILGGLEEDSLRTLHESRVELLTDPEMVSVRDRVIACLRHGALLDKFNMDPRWMLKLMEDYGPLDWRAPYMHAIYWSSMGDMKTKGRIDLDENDSMNAVRYLLFGLALTVKRGKMIIEPDFDKPTNSYLELMPDSRFVPYLHASYLKFGKEQFGDDPRFIEGTAGPSYSNGHYSFLADGVRQLYTEGGARNLALAKEYYAYLREYNRESDGSVQPQYLLPLDKFVMAAFYSNLVSFKRANMEIGALIIRSLKYLSVGESTSSVTAMDMAKKGWEFYMKDKYIDVGGSDRRHMAPLRVMRASGVIQFMNIPSVHVLHKARLWKRLELPTRQRAYDRLAPYFRELCESHTPILAEARAFPEPPGMEDYRLTREAKQDESDVQVDHGEKAW